MGREAIPVPVWNVRGYRSKNSCDENKSDSASKTFDVGLSKKENNKDGFEKFGGKLDAQQLAE